MGFGSNSLRKHNDVSQGKEEEEGKTLPLSLVMSVSELEPREVNLGVMAPTVVSH